jgi:hypothetical protein
MIAILDVADARIAIADKPIVSCSRRLGAVIAGDTGSNPFYRKHESVARLLTLRFSLSQRFTVNLWNAFR